VVEQGGADALADLGAARLADSTVSMPASRAALTNRLCWVDLPDPSGPSKTRNLPRSAVASAGGIVSAMGRFGVVTAGTGRV